VENYEVQLDLIINGNRELENLLGNLQELRGLQQGIGQRAVSPRIELAGLREQQTRLRAMRDDLQRTIVVSTDLRQLEEAGRRLRDVTSDLAEIGRRTIRPRVELSTIRQAQREIGQLQRTEAGRERALDDAARQAMGRIRQSQQINASRSQFLRASTRANSLPLDNAQAGLLENARRGFQIFSQQKNVSGMRGAIQEIKALSDAFEDAQKNVQQLNSSRELFDRRNGQVTRLSAGPVTTDPTLGLTQAMRDRVAQARADFNRFSETGNAAGVSRAATTLGRVLESDRQNARQGSFGEWRRNKNLSLNDRIDALRQRDDINPSQIRGLEERQARFNARAGRGDIIRSKTVARSLESTLSRMEAEIRRTEVSANRRIDIERGINTLQEKLNNNVFMEGDAQAINNKLAQANLNLTRGRLTLANQELKVAKGLAEVGVQRNQQLNREKTAGPASLLRGTKTMEDSPAGLVAAAREGARIGRLNAVSLSPTDKAAAQIPGSPAFLEAQRKNRLSGPTAETAAAVALQRFKEKTIKESEAALNLFKSNVEEAGGSLRNWMKTVDGNSEEMFKAKTAAARMVGAMPKALKGDGMNADDWLAKELRNQRRNRLSGPSPELSAASALEEFKQKTIKDNQRVLTSFTKKVNEAEASLNKWVKITNGSGEELDKARVTASRMVGAMPKALKGDGMNADDWLAKELKKRPQEKSFQQIVRSTLSENKFAEAYGPQLPKAAGGRDPLVAAEAALNRLTSISGSLGSKANRVESQLRRGGQVLPGTASTDVLRGEAANARGTADALRSQLETVRASGGNAQEQQTILSRITGVLGQWDQYLRSQANLISRAPLPPPPGAGGDNGPVGGAPGFNQALFDFRKKTILEETQAVGQLESMTRRARQLAVTSHENAGGRLALQKAENQLTQARVALEEGNMAKMKNLTTRARNNLDAGTLGQKRTGAFTGSGFMNNVQNMMSGRGGDQQMESLALGVGFPMLFGGGPGSIVGSGIGSFIGDGFGGQILGGAIGAALDAAVVSVKALNDAFMVAGDSYAGVRATGLAFSSDLEKQVLLAKEVGDFAKARSLERGAVFAQTGDVNGNITEAAGASVAALQGAWDGVYKAVATTLGLLASPFIMALAVILRAFQFVFMVVNTIVSGVGQIIEMVGLGGLFESWNKSLLESSAAIQDQNAEMDKQILTAARVNDIASANAKMEQLKIGLKGEALARQEKEIARLGRQKELEAEILKIRQSGTTSDPGRTELLVQQKINDFAIKNRLADARANRAILEAKISDEQRYEDLILSTQAGALSLNRKAYDLANAGLDLANQEKDLIFAAEERRLKVANELFTKQQELATLRIDGARKETQYMIDQLDLRNQIAASYAEGDAKSVLEAAAAAVKIQLEGQAEAKKDKLSMELEVDKLQRDQRNAQRQLMRENDQFQRQIEALVRSRVGYERQLEDYKIQTADYQRKVARDTLQLWMETNAQMNLGNATTGGASTGNGGNAVIAAFDRIKGAYQFRSANTTGAVVKGAVQPVAGGNKFFQFMPELKAKVGEELKKLSTQEIRAAVFTGLGEAKAGSVDDFFQVVANLLVRKAKTGRSLVDLALEPDQYEANKKRGLVGLKSRRAFDDNQYGSMNFGGEFVKYQKLLEAQTVHANAMTKSGAPTGAESAYFGATGNTKGYVHGHFQTMAGVEALTADVLPVLKQLVQRGIPLEIAGKTGLRGLNDSQLVAEMRRGIAAHKKYPSGAIALDVGVPANVAVPGGVEDVGIGTRNGGIEGFLAGTNKRTLLSHLTTGSRSGGGGAGAAVVAINNATLALPPMTNIPKPVAGAALDAVTAGRIGANPDLAPLFRAENEVLGQKQANLEIDKKQRQLAVDRAMEAVRQAAAGQENLLQSQRGLALDSDKFKLALSANSLSENSLKLKEFDIDASNKIATIEDNRRIALEGNAAAEQRLVESKIKDGVPADKARADAAAVYLGINEKLNQGYNEAIQKGLQINELERQRLTIAQQLVTVQEAANNIRSLSTMGSGIRMGMGGAYASAYEEQIRRDLPEDQARRFGDAARIQERQQKAISDSEGIASAFSDALKQALDGSDISEVFSSFFKKISDIFLDRGLEPIQNWLQGQLFNLLQVSPDKVASVTAGLEEVRAAAGVAAMGGAAGGATLALTALATAASAAAAAQGGGAAGGLAQAFSSGGLGGSLITSLFSGGGPDFGIGSVVSSGLSGAFDGVGLPTDMITSLFSGGLLGFAGGGRPPVGRPSIIGENGWEVFMPDSAGTIFNQSQLPDAFVPSKASAMASGSSSIYSGIEEAQSTRGQEPLEVDYKVTEERGERYVKESDFIRGMKMVREQANNQTIARLQKSTSTRRTVGIGS
jgi:hypothetical protein